MTKVVLQVIFLGFEHSIVFVCDFPPGPTRFDDGLNRLLLHVMASREGIEVEFLVRTLIDHGDLTPIDL